MPGLPDGAVPALCATEAGGAHPRAIASSLTPDPAGGQRLSGQKRFATFAHDADILLVVASMGADAAGRNRLRVARVDPEARAYR